MHVADARDPHLGQGRGQIGLHQRIASLLRLAVRSGEDRPRRRVSEKRPMHGGDVGGETAADLGTKAGCLFSVGHDLLNRQHGAPRVEGEQAAGQHRDRCRPVGAVRDGLAVPGEEHDRLGLAARRLEHQAGAATAKPNAGGLGDREREAGRDRRIGRTAAGRENAAGDHAGRRVLAGDTAKEAPDIARRALGDAAIVAAAEAEEITDRLAAGQSGRQQQGKGGTAEAPGGTGLGKGGNAADHAGLARLDVPPGGAAWP